MDIKTVEYSKSSIKAPHPLTLEDLIERENVAGSEQRVVDDQNKQDRENAADMRNRAMESIGQTKKGKESSIEAASKQKYQRSTTFNICRHCPLQPKTKMFGHSCHVGRFGLETVCPSVEGKPYPSLDVWLQQRRTKK